MTWETAMTLAAIGLLVLIHAVAAGTDRTPAAEPAPEADAAAPAGDRDPWTRVLVAAACAAALFAVGVVVIPAVTSEESAPTTRPPTPTQPPTTTAPATTTTQPTTTTTSTTTSTTTAPTTTHAVPTTTSPTSPPNGAKLIVRATVGANGSVTHSDNRLGGTIVVRRSSTGDYRIKLPALDGEARRHTVVSVNAGHATAAVGGWAANGTLVVLLYAKSTGAPVAHGFTVAVSSRPTLPGTT